MKEIKPAIGDGERDVRDLRILLSGVPAATDRGWLGYCTVVLFPMEDGWALFDTGHQGDRHILVAALQASDLRLDHIRHIVLSHLHFDHCLNLPLFPDADVYVSRAELDYARRVSAGEIQDFSIPDLWPELLDKHRIRIVEEDMEISPTKRLRVLPGHTPGCMALFCAGGAVVCGDVVKNAWEAVTGQASQAAVGETVASASIAAATSGSGPIVPGHDAPFRMTPAGIEYQLPFRLEIKASLYPDPPERTVLTLERRMGLARIRTDTAVRDEHGNEGG